MADIIDMPKLSDTMTVGTLVKWLKKEGDTVANGDMLAEVETDKATMELECFFDGTLLKIFAPDGSQIEVGAPLCAIGEKGEKVDAPAAKAPAPVEKKQEPEAPKAEEKPAAAAKAEPAGPVADPAPAKSEPASPSAKAEADKAETPSTGSGRVKISPLAKKLAVEKNVNYSLVKGTGPGGRIVRADIIAAEKNPPIISAPTAKPATDKAKPPSWPWRSAFDKSPIQAEGTKPLSNMRATIAKRLVESKTQIPHFYLEIEVDAAPLSALRVQLNNGLGTDGVRVSVNDFILKASALALRALPAVNCSWSEAGIKAHASTHVSFAVAIDDGLITPVIKDTDQKSVFAISTEAKDLAKRAKAKKLAPAEFTGGTFCVSNLGMMGIPRFSAIINPPNAAILAVGASVKKPVVVGDQIVIGERMVLTLSCDHRVVDGALGAQFLNAVKDHLENPALLLV
ncbi:MAG: pyruvate dehydrogenase complex dihydrolipoamide acetyltransferase [Cephaloticoccus sp.]|nr:pyruvate dehydrogenase complex dihydrolipoamide acetyltransferase [Cephaloticoccus sp.]MCF7760500.1 pyruvate dehydrogenase complex dihydrolipoamide acetyltransferase [Cephaloticoccus sp.]